MIRRLIFNFFIAICQIICVTVPNRSVWISKVDIMDSPFRVWSAMCFNRKEAMCFGTGDMEIAAPTISPFPLEVVSPSRRSNPMVSPDRSIAAFATGADTNFTNTRKLLGYRFTLLLPLRLSPASVPCVIASQPRMELANGGKRKMRLGLRPWKTLRMCSGLTPRGSPCNRTILDRSSLIAAVVAAFDGIKSSTLGIHPSSLEATRLFLFRTLAPPPALSPVLFGSIFFFSFAQSEGGVFRAAFAAIFFSGRGTRHSSSSSRRTIPFRFLRSSSNTFRVLSPISLNSTLDFGLTAYCAFVVPM
mmetsp:Transcript_29279/g.70665  ORF Transcript_29279/g.70665 Transcript_29279/m.70665 type:complete len:303 (+) Transcript_29279:2190-3098(+)